MSQKRNVLIYRLGSLGDTVIALPCFHKIRQSFPEATITLLTNRPVVTKAAPLEAILGNAYFFDQILDYPIGTRNPYLLILLILKIRRLRIDTVVNLAATRSRQSVKRDRWFFKAAGIKNLIGFPAQPEDFNVSVDKTTGEIEWEANRLARRISKLGPIALQEDRFWNLRLTNSEYQSAQQLLHTYLPDKPILAISAGTKIEAKDWGETNWLNLITRLRTELPGWVLLMVGAGDEASLADRCLVAWQGEGINLCGKTTPRISAAVLQEAAFFIGHDSGPMHLAACVGTPCIAIFSARNLPRQWFPRGNNNQVLYHKTECAGCALDVCIEEKKKCILSITVDEVIESVKIIQHKKRAISQ